MNPFWNNIIYKILQLTFWGLTKQLWFPSENRPCRRIIMHYNNLRENKSAVSMFRYSLTIFGQVLVTAAVQYWLKKRWKDAAAEWLDIPVPEETNASYDSHRTARLPWTSLSFRSHWILAAGLLPVVVQVSVIMSSSVAGLVIPVISGRAGTPVVSDEVQSQIVSQSAAVGWKDDIGWRNGAKQHTSHLEQ